MELERKTLINEEFAEEVFSNCYAAKHSVQIYSAFVKRATIEKIGNAIDPSIHVTVVARWRPGDLIDRVSDLSVYEYCKAKGWGFGFKLNLHAKVFLFDDKKLMLGSANATESGFGLAMHSNDEVSVVFLPESNDLNKISQIKVGVTWMDQGLFDKISKFVNEIISTTPNTTAHVWPDYISEEIECTSIGALWMDNLPQVHFDEALQGGRSYQAVVKEFEESNVLRWLIQQLKQENDGYTNFGWVTNKLHDVLVDEPKPYRKQVKECVSLLFEWIEKTKIKNIEIRHHRQTVSLHLR
jgi:phosphatidylserine/phosphatidylglycerophosphate/cardiolipin synthase-like enzyme